MDVLASNGAPWLVILTGPGTQSRDIVLGAQELKAGFLRLRWSDQALSPNFKS